MQYYLTKAGIAPQLKTTENNLLTIKQALIENGEDNFEKLSVTRNGAPTDNLETIVAENDLLFVTRLAKDGA